MIDNESYKSLISKYRDAKNSFLNAPIDSEIFQYLKIEMISIKNEIIKLDAATNRHTNRRL